MVSKPTILDEKIPIKKQLPLVLAMPGNDAGNISICCFDYWRDDSRLKKKRQLNFLFLLACLLC
jgi:hypothetical protein